MVCERSRAHVLLEVDGELSEFERGSLTTHLRGCSDCSVYRSEIHALTKHIRDSPPEVPTLGVRARVPVSSLRTATWARLQLGAAAALAIAVVGTAGLVTQGLDRKPATPDGQETLPSPLKHPDVNFSRGEFHGHGPTPGSSAPTGAGLELIL